MKNMKTVFLRAVAFAMIIVMITGIFTAFITPVSAAVSSLNGGTFYIQARGSNLVLDVRNGSRDNGARVWLWYHNRSVAQQWRFRRQLSGSYIIEAVHSGRVMEVRNSSRQNGGIVAQWDNANIATQRWNLRPVGDGYIEIINANSGLALDVTGGRFQQGNYLQQFQRNGTRSQHFRLVPAGGSLAGNNQGGNFRITARTGLNVRQSPNASAAIVTAIPYNTTVHVTEISGNWGRTAFNNRTGWISLDHAVRVNGATTGGGAHNISHSVPHFLQGDARWANVMITTRTIGQVGCLIVSLAMVDSHRLGRNVFPDEMRRHLTFSGNEVNWQPAINRGTVSRGPVAANFNSQAGLQQIHDQLRAGRPVIVGGSNAHGGWHWVVITGYSRPNYVSNFRAQDFSVNDPAGRDANLYRFMRNFPNNSRIVL